MALIYFNRFWAMPTKDTFDCPPIGDFVKKYLKNSKISIDPFARNKLWATYTNDLNPLTVSEYHMEAGDFLKTLVEKQVKADLILFDPPYSVRQVAECYAQVGRKSIMQDTQAQTWTNWRTAIEPLCTDEAIVLSFGWNTVGMGLKRGFEILEIILVCHGGVHNDTICMAERKLIKQQGVLFAK